MHISYFLVLFLVLCTVSATKLPSQDRMDETSLAGKCNIDVCFAIDGSFTLLSWQFQLQKRILGSTVRQIRQGNSVSVAGVQYGLDNLIISPLTNDTALFLRETKKTRFERANSAFVAGGLAYCFRQLRNSQAEAVRIVLLGAGISDFGGDPVVLTNLFKNDGGDRELLAIGIGMNSDKEALKAIAGSADNVFSVNRGGDIEPVISSILSKLCGIEPPKRSIHK